MRAHSITTIGIAVTALFAWTSSGCSTFAQQYVSNSVNTIPIKLQEDHATVLTAKVAGVDMLLQFDLGDSTPLVLQQSALDAIKAVPTGDTVKMQGTDGEFEVPTYKVPRIQIGSAVFTNVTARLDTSRKGYEPKEMYRGYLGTGLLKSNAVVLDYAHHRMMLLPGEGASLHKLCRGTEVKFSDSSPAWKGEAVTEVDTDYGRVILWWDTAGPSTVLSKSSSRATHLPNSSERAISKQFRIGGRNFGPWQIDLWDVSLPGFDGFIGDDFFKKHRVCINYPASRVVIAR